MKVKNFATFGLFVDGEIIDSGSIHAMENEATRRILSGQSEAAHISVFDFDGDKVVEKAPVLSLRRNNDNIIHRQYVVARQFRKRQEKPHAD